MLSARPDFRVALFWLLICGTWLTPASAEADEYMGKVTASPGKIVDGDKTLAEVPAGTQLWVFSELRGWAEVKVPNREQYGWINVESLKKVVPGIAEQLLLDQAKAKYDEALAARRASKFEESYTALEECLLLRRQALDKNHPFIADTLTSISNNCRYRGDYNRALEASQEALEIRRTFAGQEHEIVAISLRELGMVQIVQAKYAEARKNLELALAIQKRRLHKDDTRIAKALSGLGTLLNDVGDYAAAQKAIEEAVAIMRKENSNNTRELAAMIDLLGTCFKRQGAIAEARQYYEEALEMNRKRDGNDSVYTAASLSNVGSIYRQMGDYARSIKMQEEALAFYQKNMGDNSYLTLSVKMNLAMARKSNGDIVGAEQVFQEIFDARKKALGNEHPALIGILRNLADVKMRLKNYDEAQVSFNEALRIARKVYAEDHPDIAGTNLSLGILAIHQNNHVRAREYFQEAISLQRRRPSKSRTLSSLLALQAIVSIRTNDIALARREYDEARRLEQQYIQQTLPGLMPAEQLLYLEKQYVRDWFQSLSFGMLRPQDAANLQLSADWLINGKAVAQDALAARELLARDANDEQLGPLVQELQQVRQQLAGFALNAPKKKEEVAKRQAEVTRLTERETQLVRQLTQKAPHSAPSSEWITHSKLRAAIPADAIYIDIVRMPQYDFVNRSFATNHYWAWIMPAAGQGELQLLDLGDAEEIEKLLQQARTNLAAASGEKGTLGSAGEKAATQAINKDLQTVADLVLKPLAPALAGKKQLILSPDGSLWLLPWAALPLDGDKLLVEQCSIKLVTSGRDLLKTNIAATVGLSAPAIVVNPDYDLNGQAAAAAIKAVLPDAKFDEVATRGFGNTSKIPRVKPLPYTAYEGQLAEPTLSDLARVPPVTFAQERALETMVKRFKRPKYLLIATHGFFLPDQEISTQTDKTESSDNAQSEPAVTATGQVIENPLLRCGLLFAGCNATSTVGLDDGILTGLEIVGMDLRGTELVVLSACETGVGKVRNGEGVAGLRQAFQLAGARTVVSTLWQVPDRDSALVMQDFFKNLGTGQSKADALRNAQIKRIEARREKSGTAHPFYWAAWTVTE